MSEVPACAHSVIRLQPFTDGSGLTTDKWICDHCQTQFASIPIGVYTALEAERDALRNALEALVVANEFELPAVRDGEKTNERLDILSRCAREARAVLGRDGGA